MATTNAAGSKPRNTTSDHHTIASRGLAEKNARNNRHSADWRNRRTLAPPEPPMFAHRKGRRQRSDRRGAERGVDPEVSSGARYLRRAATQTSRREVADALPPQR